MVGSINQSNEQLIGMPTQTADSAVLGISLFEFQLWSVLGCCLYYCENIYSLWCKGCTKTSLHSMSTLESKSRLSI